MITECKIDINYVSNLHFIILYLNIKTNFENNVLITVDSFQQMLQQLQLDHLRRFNVIFNKELNFKNILNLLIIKYNLK